MKTDGRWITVRPDDPRIEDGSRVHLGGVEGEARREFGVISAYDDGPSAMWCSRCEGGPDIELWEPTLPLPTEPGWFWGRVERGHDIYIGWMLYAPTYTTWPVYCSPTLISGTLWHGPEHVTRLPVPDEELEELR